MACKVNDQRITSTPCSSFGSWWWIYTLIWLKFKKIKFFCQKQMDYLPGWLLFLVLQWNSICSKIYIVCSIPYLDMEWTSTNNMGYQCIYNANKSREDIIQKRCLCLLYKLCKKMEQNSHGTTSQWKTYKKQLFSKDLEIRDASSIVDSFNADNFFIFEFF